MRRWRAANPDKQAAANKRWREANPEAARASQASWAARNKNYWHEWYRRNVDRQLALGRLWRELNREASREITRRRRARLAEVTVVEFSTAALAARLSMYPRCWICKTAEPTHVDHVKPLSRGGAHMLGNLRPACSDCNLSKGSTWPFSP